MRSLGLSGKVDLSKGYGKPKRKLRVTTHFSVNNNSKKRKMRVYTPPSQFFVLDVNNPCQDLPFEYRHIEIDMNIDLDIVICIFFNLLLFLYIVEF